ncbi:hypothetical protein [Streptomonospora arabica]|uniref:4Fe-4S Wbl-type domain-containing protein n=1 Tax=Streptomonospora arabica TaxID=412417 RepID=A0ABV9SSN8_9ACTN
MSDLRGRIADALASAAMHPDPNADWTDAVMGVVGPEIASMWDQIDRDQHAAMDAHAALARVRELHASDDDSEDAFCDHCRVPYPCPTIRTIDGSTDE